jgi:hypothetical protein
MLFAYKPYNKYMNSMDPDQTARQRRLV